jgi:hypothetical protein
MGRNTEILEEIVNVLHLPPEHLVHLVSAVGQSVPPAVESKCTTFEGENGSI